MKSFHNDPAIKAKYLARVKQHQAADQLVQNYGYWKDGKGCAVGCTIHSGRHADYETELGIPRLIARLEDGIFEVLPVKEARTWPGRFLKAIPVGADLSQVGDRFLHWMLVDVKHGVIRLVNTDKTRNAIQAVADLFARRLKGEAVEIDEWKKAQVAAASAVVSDSGAYAYDAVVYAVVDAACAYAYDAPAYAFHDDARVVQSKKLLELLKAA